MSIRSLNSGFPIPAITELQSHIEAAEFFYYPPSSGFEFKEIPHIVGLVIASLLSIAKRNFFEFFQQRNFRLETELPRGLGPSKSKSRRATREFYPN